MFAQDVNVGSGRRSVEDNSCLLHQMSKTDNLVKTSKCVCWEGATRRIVKRSYGRMVNSLRLSTSSIEDIVVLSL